MREIVLIALPLGAFVLWSTYPSLSKIQVSIFVLILIALALMIVREFSIARKREKNGNE
jgi:hypothetical protein